MRQPPLAGIITNPALVYLVLRVLDALQLVQKNFQISRGDNKLFDIMVNWVAILTNILGDNQPPGAVAIGQTLRNQECPMGEIPRKVLAEIENQILRGAATIGLSDFLHNVRCYHVKSLRHIENSKVRRFQLRGDNSVQQVQAVGEGEQERLKCLHLIGKSTQGRGSPALSWKVQGLDRGVRVRSL